MCLLLWALDSTINAERKRRHFKGDALLINSLLIKSRDDSDFLDADILALSEEYIQSQKRAEERAERTRKDEEYARSLQNGTMNPPSTHPYNNAFNRISGIPQSNFTASQPSLASSSRTHHSNIKHEPFSSSTSAIPFGQMDAGVKSEPSAWPSKVQTDREYSMPGAFGDDFSDDSDSDIEIIPSSAFRDNGRYTASPARPSSAFSRAKGLNAPRLPMFPNMSVPSWAEVNGNSSPSINAHSNQLSGPNPSQRYRASPYDSAYGPSGPPLANYENVYSHSGSVLGNPAMQMNGTGYGFNRPGWGMNGNSYGAMSVDETLEDFRSKMNRGEFEGNYDQYDYIMNDPRKTNEEIKNLLENIKSDVDLDPENREGTPDGLKYPLYEHQKIALTWLKAMETGNNKGGILADDMGLGKTISSLALILSRPSTDRRRKTTLIIGPVALIRQWEREIKTKITGSHKLSVHLAHGAKKKLTWDQISGFDIVMTTYGTLGAEYKRYEKFREQEKGRGNHLDSEEALAQMKKLFPMLGPRSQFYRIILDEAQSVKNQLALASRAVCSLQSLTRFCLTGTPMMNTVGELQSLIKFLRIRPYNDPKQFKREFSSLYKGIGTQKTTDNAMRKLQALIKAILLRRTKKSLIDGKPIIELPLKTEEIQHVVFNEDEQSYYNSLEQKTQVTFNRYMKAGTVGKNYSNVLVLLLRLRQCCCHPHLIQDLEEAPPDGSDISSETMVELANNLAPDVVTRLLAAESFECPICYDVALNPTLIIPCGHDTCSECLARISQQQAVDNIAAGNEGESAAKCPTCRGKVDMNKLINYSTFVKVYKPEEAKEDNITEVDSDDDDTSNSESDSDDDEISDDESDMDVRGNLRGFIVPDTSLSDLEDEDNAANDIKDDEDDAPHKKKSKPKKKKKDKRSKIREGKRPAKKSKKGLTMAKLKIDAKKSKANGRRYMRYLKKNWQPSAKIEKAMELLEQFQQDGQKTIIFSQFVTLLDLLQVPIDEKGWGMERYDGGMRPDERNAAINRFTDKPNTKIMLISLKAGNAGLNLVAASRVIILDPFWNPYIEMQAIDRAYRIGQQREVQVHRILVQNTVEDRIIELQEKKKRLVDAALDEGASKSMSRLGERELAFLFGVGPQ